MGKIVYGKDLSKRLKQELNDEITSNVLNKGKRIPRLDIVLVGNDPASESYVRSKTNASKQVNIETILHHLPEDATQDQVNDLINDLNSNELVDGLLVQLPLPKHLDSDQAIDLISPDKDVDGLTELNAGKLFTGKDDGLFPCTAAGIIAYLKEMGVEIAGKLAVVVGRSNIVGLPVSRLLLKENATVITCHSKTKNLKELTSQADILISATGQPEMITAEYVKEGAYVIDVGCTLVNDSFKGDVKLEDVVDKVAAISPVPGGVGRMTTTMLMYNTYKAYKLRIGAEN